jgi:hypothetical protein
LENDPRDLSFQKLEFRLRVMGIAQKIRKVTTKMVFWSGR